MRALLVSVLMLSAACTSDTLGSDTAYRRLVDAHDSEAACVANGNFDVCYQTLTLCANGRVRLDLVNSPKDGEYSIVDGGVAVAYFLDMSIEFDLERQVSPDLPGRHAWEKVTPLVYDCAVDE